MKRKEELEVIIPSMARRLSMMFEHIANGNTDGYVIEQITKEIATFQEYINELNELKNESK